jgi:hypothetical protein
MGSPFDEGHLSAYVKRRPDPILIGFIDSVRVVGRLQVGAASLIQFWSIFMDPPVDCGVIDLQSPLQHDLFQISIAQGITQIPTNTQHDDFALEMAPPEKWKWHDPPGPS